MQNITEVTAFFAILMAAAGIVALVAFGVLARTLVSRRGVFQLATSRTSPLAQQSGSPAKRSQAPGRRLTGCLRRTAHQH